MMAWKKIPAKRDNSLSVANAARQTALQSPDEQCQGWKAKSQIKIF